MTPATWVPIKVRCAVPDGFIAREGWRSSVTPFLAVTVVSGVIAGVGPTDLGVKRVSPHEVEPVYGVTHINSGRALAKWFQRLEAAQYLLVKIAALTDWGVLDVAVLEQNTTVADEFLHWRADVYRREAHGHFGPFDVALAEGWNIVGSRESEVDSTPARLRPRPPVPPFLRAT